MTSSAILLDLYANVRRSISLRANSMLKEIDLGLRQFIILWSLTRNKRMTVGEIVEASMTDAATVSRCLAQLIEDGYIEKIKSEHDGRVWHVKLTTKGRALAPKLEKTYLEIADACFASLKIQEKNALADLLGKVIASSSIIEEQAMEY